MKKRFLAVFLMAMLMLNADANRPDFKKMSERIKTAMLQQNQPSNQGVSRAAASRLIGTSRYDAGIIDDSSEYIYNNNFANFNENDILVYVFYGEIWKYDSITYYDQTLNVDGSGRRFYSGETLTSEVVDYGNGIYRYTITYDGQGRVNQFAADSLSGVNWTPNEIYKIVYNQIGKIDSLIGFEYPGGILTNDYLEVYSYNGTQLLQSALSYRWMSGVWQPSYKSNYTYNISDKLVKEVSYYTNLIPFDYGDSTLYSYPSSTLILDTVYYIDTDTISSGRAGFTINNAAGKPVLEVRDVAFYDIFNQTWLSGSLDSTSYLYNSYDQEIVQEYLGSDYVRYSYYETYNAVTGIAETYINMQGGVFPNPAQNLLNINLKEVAQGAMSISVYNINGQLVQQTGQPAMTQTQINIDHLSAGNYTIKVTNAGKQFTGKFVKAY